MALVEGTSGARGASAPERRHEPGGGRTSIALQVAFASLLAAAAVVLVTWLAERPGLRLRHDLSAEGRNTLSESSLAVIEGLPAEVAVDVFFRPGDPALAEVVQEIHARMRHLLVLARDSSAGRLRVEDHDLAGGLSDPRDQATRAETRLSELGVREVEPGGLVVLSLATRSKVLRLRGDLADVDPGDPSGRFGPARPARLLAFRGEEALASALREVSQPSTARVVFSRGHGELDPQKADLGGVALLARELERDGFTIAAWDGERQATIDPEALVLAVIAPEQPFTPAERAEIERFLRSGGRLVAAPGFQPESGEHSLAEILAGLGIQVVEQGFVARPIQTATGQVYFGRSENSALVVSRMMMAAHATTEPLRRGDRRIVMPFSRELQRGKGPAGGTVLDLLRSPDESWRDLPPASGLHDWVPDPNEARGPFVIAMASIFPATLPVPEERARQAGARESRALCLGSASAFANENFASNRDFLLNAFNWVAAREYRVHVRPRDPVLRRIDVTSGRALATVNLVSAVALPLLCLGLGAWTAFRRRRR